MTTIRNDSPEVDAHIGGRIARVRQSRGLSQTTLAQRIGVSFQQVQKYETGQNRVACSRLFQIAKALGVAPADLFPPTDWTAIGDTDRTQKLHEARRFLTAAAKSLEALS